MLRSKIEKMDTHFLTLASFDVTVNFDNGLETVGIKGKFNEIAKSKIKTK